MYLQITYSTGAVDYYGPCSSDSAHEFLNGSRAIYKRLSDTEWESANPAATADGLVTAKAKLVEELPTDNPAGCIVLPIS